MAVVKQNMEIYDYWRSLLTPENEFVGTVLDKMRGLLLETSELLDCASKKTMELENKIKKDKIIKDIKEILRGIDKGETDLEGGWWETSGGVKFGENKLNEIIAYLEQVKMV